MHNIINLSSCYIIICCLMSIQKLYILYISFLIYMLLFLNNLYMIYIFTIHKTHSPQRVTIQPYKLSGPPTVVLKNNVKGPFNNNIILPLKRKPSQPKFLISLYPCLEIPRIFILFLAMITNRSR